MYGNHVFSTSWGGKTRSGNAGNLHSACKRLVEAAKSANPASLFGYKVAPRITSIFRLGKLFKPAKRVENDLIEIIKEATKIIENTFETRTGYEGWVYRKTHFERERYLYEENDFTFLPLDEEDTPLRDEEEWSMG
jgi:hypothetical protein